MIPRICRLTGRLLSLLLLGLASGVPAQAQGAEPPVVLDGRFDEWPAGVHAQADAWNLYLRLSLEMPASLQTSRVATQVLLDLDGDERTGRRVESGQVRGSALGVDLALLFAPPDSRDENGLGSGAAAFGYPRGDREIALRHQQVGFAALPTHAATEFEIVVPRHVLEQRQLAALLRREGTARVLIRRLDGAGGVVWQSGVYELAMPAAAPGPWRAAVSLPARPADAVRILSTNVEWASPLDTPEAYARLIAALDPDIVLLQEWDRIARDARGRAPPRLSAASIAEWFNTHVPGERRWQARRSPELGIAIVSRDRLRPLGSGRIAYRLADGDQALLERGVRYLGVQADTRLGPVAVASIHLKCCGGPGAAEDLQRHAEAVTINAAFRRAIADSGAVMAVVGGDFNLVGGIEPKRLVASGLDLDGTDLTVAPARVLGGHTALTWRDPRSRFSPSRLDYMLYSASSAGLVNAFLLETAILHDAALAAAGLERGDSAFSDHLPLVIDLRRRAPH